MQKRACVTQQKRVAGRGRYITTPESRTLTEAASVAKPATLSLRRRANWDMIPSSE